MYSQDWMMRQIEMMVHLVARIVFKKDVVAYQIGNHDQLSRTDYLYKDLQTLIDKGEIGKAEDLLFEHLDSRNQDYLLLAVDFYQKLNELDDDELEAADFSREEIASGLGEIMEMFGVPQLEV
jgi:hypothetical protein